MTAGRLAQLSLGGALLIAGAGRAQEPPSFGASTELVVIDMIATDDDGQLVTDLRPDEIEVFAELVGQGFVDVKGADGGEGNPQGSEKRGAPILAERERRPDLRMAADVACTARELKRSEGGCTVADRTHECGDSLKHAPK